MKKKYVAPHLEIVEIKSDEMMQRMSAINNGDGVMQYPEKEDNSGGEADAKPHYNYNIWK